MAIAAGIPFNSYKSYEYGKLPLGDNLALIAKALGVPETALFLDPELVAGHTLDDCIKVVVDAARAGHK